MVWTEFPNLIRADFISALDLLIGLLFSNNNGDGFVDGAKTVLGCFMDVGNFFLAFLLGFNTAFFLIVIYILICFNYFI